MNSRLRRGDSINSNRCSVVFNITIPSETTDDETKFLQWSDHGDDESTGGRTSGCCKCFKCCTPCLSCLCLPCNRIKNASCCKRCRRKKSKADDKSGKITKPTVTETIAPTKESCWQRMKCCSCCSRKNKDTVNESTATAKQTATDSSMMAETSPTKERGKCALCLSKFLCCRRTNKIQSSSTSAIDDPEAGAVRKCCFCIPCGRKKSEAAAWTENRRESILSVPQKQGCCGSLCAKLLCCRRKEPQESRRTSMNSKKQSIAPTIPIEDTRPKLDMSLVEHTSMMKAAIPILPMCLAWFCLICNCFIPGLGTIFSGLFCLCLGVPRFSQHDGARARFGSFVINCIVGVAQAFTLLFCLVGWGWAIWWGTIMLRVARKRRKLRQAERDAEMQQEEQTTSSNRTAMPPIMSQNHRDVETGSGGGVSAVGGT